MRSGEEWRLLDLRLPPVLVVGWRPKPRRIDGARMAVLDTSYDSLREVGQRAVTQLETSEASSWHPYAPVEAGEEHLSLSVSDLPQASPPSGASTPTNPGPVGFDELADVLRLVLRPGDFDEITVDELGTHSPLFTALIWQRGVVTGPEESPVAFVSKHNPIQPFRSARRWFVFDGALKPVETPEFAVAEKVDLVITSDEIAVFDPKAFDALFADIRQLLEDVPANVAALAKILTKLPFGEAANEALVLACGSKPSFARRLQNLSADSSLASKLTINTLRAVLSTHNQPTADFIKGGKLSFGVSRVGAFLDIAEGRWWTADFTGERRRAGSWSRRPL
jgi:hypothetical protein